MMQDELPVVFISYSTEDEFQVRQLSEDLRKSNISAFTYPFDIDREGKSLCDAIQRQSPKSMLLLVAVTPTSARAPWVTEQLRNLVLEPFKKVLGENTYVIKLVELTAKSIPSHLKNYRIFDLSGATYQTGLQELVSFIGSPKPHTKVQIRRRSTYSPVSGIFEPPRSQTDMFAELKEEISHGRIDQKYLYWDVRAALRWQRIAELSTYMTSQMAMNLLAVHADSIINSIINDANSSRFSFINFGVGTGVKDFLVLEKLLLQKDTFVYYFAIDESLPMIQITIQGMQELMSRYADRLRIHYILDDFSNIEKFKEYINQVEQNGGEEEQPTRILGFLGGSLGNFSETKMLSILKVLMTKKDYVILGTEYIAGRDDQALIDNYSDIRMKDFLYGPISDVEGKESDWDKHFRYEVYTGNNNYSKIDRSKTIVGLISHKSQLIELFSSTKYERKPLETFLRSNGFDIIAKYQSAEKQPRYGKYVLKLA